MELPTWHNSPLRHKQRSQSEHIPKSNILTPVFQQWNTSRLVTDQYVDELLQCGAYINIFWLLLE